MSETVDPWTGELATGADLDEVAARYKIKRDRGEADASLWERVFLAYRMRLISLLPPSTTPDGVAATVLERARFTIEPRTATGVANILCPDATEDEVRQIAERLPVGSGVTINGRSAWEILQ